ncbi:uncharacterized protein LOC117644972 [Thrips palmi]|uniref:Uncharacterized protein LOC117644972 n=1 Tax=Thrips palmi TaxID=161013 RepID=A0A6P8YTD2_THRPL|nr:uncharacterized protein LOC117644972 [Thrips palmi]
MSFCPGCSKSFQRYDSHINSPNVHSDMNKKAIVAYQKAHYTRQMRGPIHMDSLIADLMQVKHDKGKMKAILDNVFTLLGVGQDDDPKKCIVLHDAKTCFLKEWVPPADEVNALDVRVHVIDEETIEDDREDEESVTEEENREDDADGGDILQGYETRYNCFLDGDTFVQKFQLKGKSRSTLSNRILRMDLKDCSGALLIIFNNLTLSVSGRARLIRVHVEARDAFETLRLLIVTDARSSVKWF